MAAEWSHAGLQVNGLAPGYVLTEMTQPLADDPDFVTGQVIYVDGGMTSVV
jgi:hypothetical protein